MRAASWMLAPTQLGCGLRRGRARRGEGSMIRQQYARRKEREVHGQSQPERCARTHGIATPRAILTAMRSRARHGPLRPGAFRTVAVRRTTMSSQVRLLACCLAAARHWQASCSKYLAAASRSPRQPAHRHRTSTSSIGTRLGLCCSFGNKGVNGFACFKLLVWRGPIPFVLVAASPLL